MTTKKDKIELKKMVIEAALQRSVSAASREFKISRPTIAKWLKNFKTEGESGLKRKDVSKKNQKNKMPAEVLAEIIDLKDKNPDWSAKRIISFLKLPYSQQTVNAKIRKHLKQPENRTKIFTKIYLKINKLKQKESRLPSYQLSAYDEGTGALFVAFSYERSNLTVSIFVDYLLQSLDSCKAVDVKKIIIFTSRGSVYRSSSKNKISLLDFIIEEKYEAKHSYSTENLKFPKNYIFTDEFHSVKDLLFKSLILTIYNNYYKENQFISGMSPLNKIRKENPEIDSNLLLIQPIVIDKHIENILELKDSKDYSYLQDNARETILEDAIKYFNALGKDYQNRDFAKKSIKIFEIAEKISKLHHDDENELYAIAVKSKAMMDIGDWKKAGDEYYRALNLAEKLDDKNYIMKIMNRLGSRASHQCRYMEALHYLKKANKIAEELNNEEYLCSLSNDIGMVYHNLGNTNKALFFFRKCAEFAKSAKDINSSIISQINFGLFFHDKSEYSKAKQYLENALEMALKYDLVEPTIVAKGNMGILYKSMGNYEKSLELFVDTLKSIRIHRMKKFLDVIYLSLGNLFADNAQYDKKNRAIKYYKKAIEISAGKDSFSNLIILYGNLGLVYLRKKMYTEAEESYDMGINIAKKIKNDKLYALSIFNKLYLLADIGRQKELVKLSKEVKPIFDEMGLTSRALKFKLIYYQADFIENKLNKKLNCHILTQFFTKISEMKATFHSVLIEESIDRDTSIRMEFMKYKLLKEIQNSQNILKKNKKEISIKYDIAEVRIETLNLIEQQLVKNKTFNYSSFLEELNMKR